MTAIRTTAELSLQHAANKEDHEQALVSILEEIDRLGRMAEQLLLLARMEAENLRENFKTVDLNGVVDKMREVYSPLLESRELTLHRLFAFTADGSISTQASMAAQPSTWCFPPQAR